MRDGIVFYIFIHFEIPSQVRAAPAPEGACSGKNDLLEKGCDKDHSGKNLLAF